MIQKEEAQQCWVCHMHIAGISKSISVHYIMFDYHISNGVRLGATVMACIIERDPKNSLAVTLASWLYKGIMLAEAEWVIHGNLTYLSSFYCELTLAASMKFVVRYRACENVPNVVTRSRKLSTIYLSTFTSWVDSKCRERRAGQGRQVGQHNTYGAHCSAQTQIICLFRNHGQWLHGHELPRNVRHFTHSVARSKIRSSQQ